MEEDTQDRFDVIRLDAKRATRTDEGFLKVPARITRTGIMEYPREGKIVREFRSPDEVFRADSLETLAGVPITVRHSVRFVTAKDTQEHAVGHVGHDVRAVEGKYVEATLNVWRADAVEKVLSGELVEVSAGYRSKLAHTPGKWHAQPYDLEQVDIRYNHAALLPKGHARGGAEMAIRTDAQELIMQLKTELEKLGLPDAQLAEALGLPDEEGVRMLLDGLLGTPDEAVLRRAADMIHMPVANLISMAPQIAPEKDKKDSLMKRNLVVNGLQFAVEIADDLAPTFDSALVTEQQLRTDSADAAEQLLKVTAERNDLQVRLDSANSAESIEAAVNARVDLVSGAAKLYADIDCVGKSGRAVLIEALTHVGHDAVRLDGAEDLYLEGLFAASLLSAEKSVTEAPRSVGPAPTEVRVDSADDSTADARHQAMVQRGRNAWKAN